MERLIGPWMKLRGRRQREKENGKALGGSHLIVFGV